MNKPILTIATCLLGSAILFIHANAFGQAATSSRLDAMSHAALDKIDKALKDKSTDAATKEKLNKIAKAIRKGALLKGSSSGIAKGDFNGDGFADLAIGIPHMNLINATDAGAVLVIYGSLTGLGHGANGAQAPIILPQLWTQESGGISGVSEDHDEFGSALASGDFNGDGFSDLAIGVPQESITIPFNGTNLVFANSGRVVVIYGSPNGLTATNPNVHPSQNFDFSIFGPAFSGGINIKGNERLGTALAWGDFNGDGVGDLAIGAPGRTVFAPTKRITVDRAGEVWVLFGSRPIVHCRGCPPDPATGGLTRTGAPAAGAPASTLPEQFLNAVEFGNIEPGTLHLGGVGSAAQDSGFGSVLAAGDFNGDCETDLVGGLPDLGFGGNPPLNIKHAGGVAVFVADALGQGLARDDHECRQGFLLTELSPLELVAAGDRYGAALAVGDFNGDTRSDLAIGIPGRTVGPNAQAGAVHVRYGKPVAQTTLNTPLPLATDSQIWTQNNIFNPLLQHSEPNEFFGSALAAGDFNGDGKADLAIGVPLEDVLISSGAQNIIMAGEVDVIYAAPGVVLGGALSIASHNPQIWTKGQTLQGTIQGQPHAGDLFGFSLSAWNFGDPSAIGNGIRGTQADLAIGAPFEDLFQISGPSAGTLVPNAGAVNVIYGSPGPFTSLANFNGLTPLGNQLWTAVSPNVNSILEHDANFGLTLY